MPHAQPVGSAATETRVPTSLAFWKNPVEEKHFGIRWIAGTEEAGMDPPCKVIKGVKPGKRGCYCETGL